MKKLLTVTLFSGLLTLLRMASGFVIAKVVAVYTGPSGIAMLGQVQSLITALNGVVAAPAGNGVVRYTAQHHEAGPQACAPWWKAALNWICLLMAVMIPVICLCAQPLAILVFGEARYFWLVIMVALALPFSAANILIASILNGQQQYRRYVGLGIVSVLIATVIMVVLVVRENLNGALIAAVLFSGISGLVMLLGVIRQPWCRLRFWWGRASKAELRGIGAYVVMAVTTALTMPMALLVVRNILVSKTGWEQAGQWQAVWKISEVYLGVITMALSTYFLPKLVSLTGSDAILKEIRSTAKIVMPIVALLAVGVYVLRDVALTLLFTEAFRAARDLFAMQLVGDVLKILSFLYAYPMVSRGATCWFMAAEVIFALLFIVLSYFLIGQYGAHGANAAYAVSYFCYLIFAWANVRNFSR
ncbi:MAG: O-antigen translocase [Janthinobacterium svalbardensis]